MASWQIFEFLRGCRDYLLKLIDGIDNDKQQGKNANVIVKTFCLLLAMGVTLIITVASIYGLVSNQSMLVQIISGIVFLFWVALYGFIAYCLYQKYIK